ncbi:MAG TPA: chorismate mutase [Anaerolineaceae bacterium]|jgi:chorismate mutase
MALRGVRGATTVNQDESQEILAATRDLLAAILDANPTLQLGDLASVFFTLTADLSSVYPAQAARQIGWAEVPLMCACEVSVPGSLPRCIRVMLHWNTDLAQSSMHHVYLGAAIRLRPDLARTT